MCGIIGHIGLNKEKTKDIILKSLNNLEYRGYDSTGMFLHNSYENKLVKVIGAIGNLEEKSNSIDGDYSLGMGHTRWATHGGVTVENTHPHYSNSKKVFIVHNGTIENYKEIKETLVSEGYKFYSETDTEVIANYIDFLIKNLSYIKVIEELYKKIKGNFALLIKFKGQEKIYFAKWKSPLIIGRGEKDFFFSSDAYSITNYTDQILYLNDGNYGWADKGEIIVYQNGNTQEVIFEKTELANEISSKAGHSHYMIKEINDQVLIPSRIRRLFKGVEAVKKIKNAERIILIASGTSYHAALVAKRLFNKYLSKEVLAYNASDFNDEKPNHVGLYIIISQSGETADLIRSLEVIKSRAYQTIGITNTMKSTIDRMTDSSVLLNAGVEISVASTKAYSAQIITFLVLIEKVLKKEIFNDKKLEKVIQDSIKDEEPIRLANKIYKSPNLFFLGRGISKLVALEASLKLKEVSYIQTEAYNSGELKHGTISLITKGTPVIGIIIDDVNADLLKTNVIETEARGASTYIFDTRDNETEIKSLFRAIVFIQLLAYYTSIKKGINPDKPRNLAKSVTVE